ncbi:MAG: hypothetical protein KDC44_02490 [Phaeodactylibacter sp.]|nr:hypothetical protein [Phaeodactylibacter sp.]
MRYFIGKHIWLLFGVVGVTLLFSCSPDERDPGVVVDVPLTFELDLFEQLDTLQNKLQLLAHTVEIQEDCINNTIDYTLDRREGKISISLNDIKAAEDCIEGQGPASATVNIGYLIPGQYDIEINLRNTVVNTGVLVVDHAFFYLSMHSIDGITLLNEQLYRIPGNTIWGYVSYDDHGLVDAANAFLSELTAMTYPFDYPEGYYGHFKLGSNASIDLLQPSTDAYSTSMVRLLTGERQDLENLIETYQNEHTGLQIRLWDGQGVLL